MREITSTIQVILDSAKKAFGTMGNNVVADPGIQTDARHLKLTLRRGLSSSSVLIMAL